MEEEFFELSTGLLSDIEKAKASGKRIIAVGTTTTRALEGFFSGQCATEYSNGTVRGSTDIFIFEGYRFRAIDSLITNFHLPRSTPLLLTSALAGRQKLLNSYRSAVDLHYRFFSYGDAMILI
jgi:S-adenosylmethionine:tRNA ribosyltransferase-isomerase